MCINVHVLSDTVRFRRDCYLIVAGTFATVRVVVVLCVHVLCKFQVISCMREFPRKGFQPIYIFR